jgi:hypothetical protein
MSLFRMWAKSGAIKTLESRSINIEESRLIIELVPNILFDEMRRLSKKLNNQQKNLLLSRCCLIYFQVKNEKYHHLQKIRELATGYRFQIYQNFNLDCLKLIEARVTIATGVALGEEIEHVSDNEIIKDYDYQTLKEEFEQYA